MWSTSNPGMINNVLRGGESGGGGGTACDTQLTLTAYNTTRFHITSWELTTLQKSCKERVPRQHCVEFV